MTVLADESRIGNLQRALASVVFIVELLIALEPAKMRQQGVPAPELATRCHAPPIVIAGVSAHVHLRVDAAAAAEDPAGGNLEFSIVQVSLLHRAMHGAVPPLRHELAVAGSELEVGAAIVAALLQ